MSTPVIRVENLSKRFVIRKEKSLKERIVNFGRSELHKDDFWALRDVDVEVEAGTTVGLVGPNGSGKSTLLKMVGGILQPTYGSVSIRGRLAALLELGAGFHPDLTGRENVYLNASILGLSREQTDKYFDAIVDFSGIEKFIDTQVKFYSSGMYVRLAFAVAVHVDPDILLVDEVLAVGDEPFQRKCMDRIRQFQHDGRTILFVSHSLDQVAELCDRAIVLESGRVIADGEPRDALKVLRSEFDQIRAEELERRFAAEAAAAEAASALADAARPGQATEPVSDEVAHAQADAALAEKHASSSSRPRVESVVLLGADDTPVETLRSGDDATVAVTINAPTPLVNAVVGMGIDTGLGVAVFGTNTLLLGTRLPTLQGRMTVRFPVTGIHLGEGSYTLHGAIAAEDGSELDRLRDSASLTVENDGRSVGLTWFPALDPVTAQAMEATTP